MIFTINYYDDDDYYYEKSYLIEIRIITLNPTLFFLSFCTIDFFTFIE